MKKRLISVFLSLCIIISLLPSAALAVSTDEFSDFPASSHWAYDALSAAVDNGLLKGNNGKLMPEGLLTRAQLAAVINRAFGATEKADISGFTDVPATAWFAEDIAKAVHMGTFSGDGGGLMRPNDAVTRQEAFTVLARAFCLEGGSAAELVLFTDSGSVASWAVSSVAAMVRAGYVKGSRGAIRPLDTISRQEFAQVMYNLVSLYIYGANTHESLPAGNVVINSPGATLKNVTVSGDLIVAVGVNDGGITLSGVTIKGRIVVCGGGSSAINFNGSTAKGEIVVTAADAGIVADDSSVLNQITVGANNVTITAKSGTVTVQTGVTGTKVNGKELAGGQKFEIDAGSSGGGGTPPTPMVATTTLNIKAPTTVFVAGTGYDALTASRNSGANDALTWESDDKSVVKVNATSGKLSAVGTGSAVISAESASGVVGSATVYVVNPSDSDLTDNKFEYTITEPGTVLENCSFTKLTIAASVGTGEVTLRNVTAEEMIVLGGGQNTVQAINGYYRHLFFNGTSIEGTRLLVSGDAVVSEIEVGGGASNGVTVEKETGSAASIGEITAAAPTTIKGADVAKITSSADLTVRNSTVTQVKTTGNSPAVTLTDSTVAKVDASAASTIIGGNSAVQEISASGAVTTGADTPVGTIAASGSANVTANGAVGSITGTAGKVSLNNSGATAVTASADSISVSGESKPTVSGTVPTVTVAANSEGTSGVTVTGITASINTIGAGSVGEISIGGNATPTVNTGSTPALVSVSDTAGATVTGSNAKVVNTSTGSNTVTNSGTQIAAVTPALQYIAVTSLPTKTEYATTDTALNTAGLVVTGYYTVIGFDGTISKAINVTSGMLSGFSAVAGTHEVTVTHESKTAKFNVTVVAKTVSSISIRTAPTTRVYDLFNGAQTLNVAGGTVTVNYTSSLYQAEIVDITTAMCSGYALTAAGAKTVTVTYGGKTASFSVNVINSAADAFALAQSNAKAEFLAYVSGKLIDNTYSETGKASVKKAREAGVAAIGALTYPTNDTTAITAAITAHKMNIDNILTQDGEWMRDENSFKSTHSVILATTAANVLISDKAAVSTALNAYNALEIGVKNKLTAEKTLLDSLLQKIATLEAAQTLETAQSTAKSTLTAAHGKYSTGYATNKNAIDSAKAAGDSAIEAATTVAAVTAALDTALANMASFKSDVQLLLDAQTSAINEINTYLPNNMAQVTYNSAYNATGKAQISELRSAGVEAINTATTIAEVISALNAAKGSIDSVLTAARMTAATLASAKAAAKTELNAYGNADNYRQAQKAELTNARITGCTAIDAATTTAAVTTALKAAKTTIDTIKTDAQLTASELAADKTTAKAELNGYYPTGKAEADYSTTGNSLIAAMRSAGCTAIDAASDANAVDTALSSAKTNIDGVKTIEGENTDVVAAAKTAAEAATYATVAQASYATEASLAVYVKGIAETAVGTGITVTVTQTAYTAPIAGTLADLDGTAGSYSFALTLTKDGASATTTAKTVTITATPYTANPAVAVTPTSASVDYMGGTTLTAVANDIQNPTYQWYKDSIAIEGETTDTLTLTNLTAAAVYYCMCGEVKSNEVAVIVEAQGTSAVPTAVISGMAASYTLPYSKNITLSVSQESTYTYKWEYKDAGSSTWQLLGTSHFVAVNTLQIGWNGRQYRCTVTNTELNKLPATATSEVVTLSIQKGTQAAPTGLVAVQTSYDANDGKITGVTTAMEYKLSTVTGYTACSGMEIAGLAAGTYLVRFAETANLSASDDTEITVTGTVAPLMVNGVAYTELQTALNAAQALSSVNVGEITYTPYQPVEVVDVYTITSSTVITVEQGHSIVVKSGGSLTNNGTIKYHKSSMSYAMFDSGEVCVEKGGSYTVGTTKLVGGGDALFNLLDKVMDSEDSTKVAVEQGEVWITGVPMDATETEKTYDRPFLILNGNIEVPTGKTCTVSDTDYMTFIAGGDLSVNGTLTSTAFNEIRGGVTVESTGSLILNNSAQTGGPAYSIGDESVPHSMGGSVFVKYGGSYTVGTTKLIGTSGAKLNMVQDGDAIICGQPADGGENPFVFLFDDATAADSNWESYHFIVDAYTDNGTTHSATLTIPAGAEVTLGSNEIRGNIMNNGNLVATNGLGVDGSITNNGTITNRDTIHLLPGSSMTNQSAGVINGLWNSNHNPEDANDGWWQTQILVEFSADPTTLANPTLTNSGAINDSVTICDFFGSEAGSDKLTAVTNSGSGTIAETYRVAYVDTTAGLKRAIADTTVDEYHPIGNFVLTEDVTIPANRLLYMPLEWYNGRGEASVCTFTINAGVTLTNNGAAEFIGLTNVNGSIVNNGYIYSETRYLADSTKRGIWGSGSVTGYGEYNVTAYVCSAAGIVAAADNGLVSEMYLCPPSDYDFYNETDNVAARTVTLSENVTIPEGEVLVIDRLDVNDGSTLPVVLTVPEDKTLTVNGELILKGKLTIESGGTVTGTGTLTKDDSAEITNNGTLNISATSANVTTEAQLRSELVDTFATGITIAESIDLSSDLEITKPVTIAEGWDEDNDMPTVTLRVPEGKSLTISADIDVKGGLVGENGSITIAAGKTVTVSGRMGYISGNAANASLTVNGTLILRNGAGLVLGSRYPTDTATAAGSLVNSGAIDVIHGWVDFISSDEQTVVSGTAINRFANRADLARELVNRLSGYPNMVEPLDGDFETYGNSYSDWGDMYGNDENPDNDDSDSAHGLVWLLKNGIIAESGRYIRPYGELPAAEAKAIFTVLATRILGEDYSNTVMTTFLFGLSENGYISIANIHIEEGNYDTNALNQLIDGFIAALNLSSEDVTTETELTAALAKSYVTEIHITGVNGNLTITGKKDNESDTNKSYYLSPSENGDRRIYINAGVTLTVGDGTNHTKLDINQSAELIIVESDSGNGHLTIAENSGINCFGGLKPDNWGDEGKTLVTQADGSYLNFFPDVMDFGQRLVEKVGTRLDAPEVTEETKNSANEWPNGDGRIAGFEFLVAYGNLNYKTETDGYKHWTPYDKLEYSVAIDVLTSVYKAIETTATALPNTVKLDGYQNDYLVNDNDLSALLEEFGKVLPALPNENDTTASFTVDGTNPTYSNKNYTNTVTISYSGIPEQNGWGGEIRFENCTFAAGVAVNYSDSARFAVDFSDNCTVTDGVGVVPNNSTTLWKNSNVELWGAKGLTVTATAPTSISCGSDESFTLNGVVVSGTYGETQDENWFSANIRYNCDAKHDESFDWSNGGNHSACKMPDGTTTATTSPEFQLCTGTDGTIAASNTAEIAMNVRVEGNADISGLSVAKDYEITVSDYNRAASVNIGANPVYIYDNGNNGYAITGTTGTATVRGQIFGNVSGITLGTVDLGTPHVFGDSASGYQIFVGYPSNGSAGDVSFTVRQGDTVLTHAVDDQYLDSDGKLHLTNAGESAWITDPGNVCLIVTISGVSVVYEPLAFKETVAATIGSSNYETLEAAINAVTEGQTVKLEDDVETSAVITISKSLTINTNGHTITRTNITESDTRIFKITGGTTTLNGGGLLTIRALNGETISDNSMI